MCREDNSSDMKSNSETLLPLIVKRPAGILKSNIFRLTCVKLTTALENFKGVVSDNLSFASLEMDKNCWLTLPRWKSLCHGLSRDQPQPGSFFPRPRRQRRETLGTRLDRFAHCVSRHNSRCKQSVTRSPLL